MVNQVNKDWNCFSVKLTSFRNLAIELMKLFESVTIQHAPRTQSTEPDIGVYVYVRQCVWAWVSV